MNEFTPVSLQSHATMSFNRDRLLDRRSTRELLAGEAPPGDPSRPNRNWLGHAYGTKACRCDEMLLKGATVEAIQAAVQYGNGTAGVLHHIHHLRAEHGIPVAVRADGTRIIDASALDDLPQADDAVDLSTREGYVGKPGETSRHTASSHTAARHTMKKKAVPLLLDDLSPKRVEHLTLSLSVEQLHRKFTRKILDVAPNFQRKFVWDTAKCVRLLESILLNYPVPPVYLAETKDGKEEVIDGQQRLTAIFEFLVDGYRLRKPYLAVLREEVGGKTFSELRDDQRDRISDYNISIIKIRMQHPKR